MFKEYDKKSEEILLNSFKIGELYEIVEEHMEKGERPFLNFLGIKMDMSSYEQKSKTLTVDKYNSPFFTFFSVFDKNLFMFISPITICSHGKEDIKALLFLYKDEYIVFELSRFMISPKNSYCLVARHMKM